MRLLWPDLDRDAMLELVTGPDLTFLADRLAETLRREPLRPEQKETIVIGSNRGVTPWLGLQLAERIGIAASLTFPSPARFIRSLARHYIGRPEEDPTEAEDPAFDTDPIIWRILLALDSPLTADHPRLQRYLEGAGPLKRYRLALRLTRLFSMYGAYRPEMVNRWSRDNREAVESEDEAWQRALWKSTVADSVYDEPSLYPELLDRLATDRNEMTEPPYRRVSIFGTPVIPSPQLEVIEAFAKRVPVTWYLHTWSSGSGQYHWNAERAFAVSQPANTPTLQLSDPVHAKAAPSNLGRLQRMLVDGSHGAGSVAGSDESVQIHCCHSPVRELEVARDLILDAFDKLNGKRGAGLRPHDVLVAVTDPNVYGPLAESIFGAGDGKRPDLPCHVVHRGSPPERAIASAVVALLGLVGSRFTAGQVLGLLNMPAIRRSAGIQPHETATLRAAMHRAGVRWGIDADHKETFGLDTGNIHTWRMGIDRHLLGHMMGTVDELFGDLMPIGGASGKLIGRFAHWLDDLTTQFTGIPPEMQLQDWEEYLIGCIKRFVVPEGPAESVAFQRVLRTIHHLGKSDSAISFDVVRSYLEDRIPARTRADRYVSGKVTVSDLTSFQGVPFKVILILGLDDGSFPRTDKPPSFNLLKQSPRPGDPSFEMADRQVFLDLVLSARERLYLLYTGRSRMDDSERAPSILVDLLRQVAGAAEIDQDDTPVAETQHRIQAFSPAYFDRSASHLFSYDSGLCNALRASHGRREPVSPFVPAPVEWEELPNETVSLRTLQTAWVNPSQLYCNHTLHLRYPWEEEPPDEDEPMELDYLARYALDSIIVEDIDRPQADSLNRAVATGMLPPGKLGDSIWHKERGRLETFIKAVGTLQWLPATPFRLQIGRWTLIGSHESRTREGLLFFRPAKLKPKDLIRAWIRHLAYCADRVDELDPSSLNTSVVGLDKSRSFTFEVDACGILLKLLDRLPDMLAAPLPIFEKSSHRYAKSKRKNRGYVKRTDFFPSDYASGDTSDKYVALCFRAPISRGTLPHEDTEAYPGFDALATSLWNPILDHLDSQKK